MIGDLLWAAGVLLLVAAAVFSILGLLGGPPPVTVVYEAPPPPPPDDDWGPGWMIDGPNAEQAAAAARSHRVHLRFTRIGVLLAATGGLALAFGTQPWA